MLQTSRVALPGPVEMHLQQTADFFDNVMDFARDDLIGFRRPIAMTFALLTPFVAISAYGVGTILPFAQIMASYLVVAAAGFYLVGRREWPKIAREFVERSDDKRRAAGDLKCGFGELSTLTLRRAPRFYEHAHGVLVFADAGEFKTLFLSIDADDDDPRWQQYLNGRLNHQIWSWMRLPVSRELVKFEVSGKQSSRIPPALPIRSVDAWEAIHVAFGEPLDGAVIHRPFNTVIETVDTLL